MPHSHRSVAFSNKQKKEQLKAKRERKRQHVSALSETSSSSLKQNFSSSFSRKDKYQELHFPPSTSTNFDEIESIPSKNNRYNLKFRKDHSSKHKKHQYEPIVSLSPTKLEEDIASFFPSQLDYPRRPPWKKNMTKTELDLNENRSFRLYCKEIEKKYQAEDLSLYEMNLETWRQLWRVTEMSDILLIIVDARFVVAQFPPYLYNHLQEKENKGIVLILNKCDLISPALILAWQDYFVKRFPRLRVLPFCSIESNCLKKKTNLKMAYESASRLVNICQELVGDDIDLSCWKEKISDERNTSPQKLCQAVTQFPAELTSSYYPMDEEPNERFKDGIVTIGTIGHPNVGKSSLINALMGKKVVSVSKTPGHTKHFQTIFLTKNVKLCDCPGLVFPSLCPKQLQVVLGSYPVAQVRNPVDVVSFIAERINIVLLLKLEHPQQDSSSDQQLEWSPFDICEAWALKRRYFTRTKGGRADVHRAANEILRFTLVGFKSLILALRPPNFGKNEVLYESDPRKEEIKVIQGVHAIKDIEIWCGTTRKKETSRSESEEDSFEESTSSDQSDLEDTSDEEGNAATFPSGSNQFMLLDASI